MCRHFGNKTKTTMANSAVVSPSVNYIFNLGKVKSRFIAVAVSNSPLLFIFLHDSFLPSISHPFFLLLDCLQCNPKGTERRLMIDQVQSLGNFTLLPIS
jgi:hypothetical protein